MNKHLSDVVWNTGAGCKKTSELSEPLKWRKPRKVLVNSTCDLFCGDLPDLKLDEIFGVILACHILNNIPNHIFQIITKHPGKMLQYFNGREPETLLKAWAESSNWITLDNPDMLFEEIVYGATCRDWDKNGRNSSGSEHKPWGYINKLWPLPNIWLGVSVENRDAADEQIPLLLQIPAAVRFVSAEPLLGPVNIIPYLGHNAYKCKCGWHKTEKNLDLQVYSGEKAVARCITCGTFAEVYSALDWVIVGGETGHNARPIHPDWVRSLRDQCQDADVPFFFKQWGEWAPIDEVECGVLDDNIHRLSSNIIIGPEGVTNGEGWNGTISSPEMLKDKPLWHLKKVGKQKSGRKLDGRTWDEKPDNN